MTAADSEPIVDDPDRVVVRDRRRLDPETGAVREAAGSRAPHAASPDAGSPDPDPASPDAGSPDPDAGSPDPEVVEASLVDPVAELTADLQRVTAEYANYRKRVDRDRLAVVEMATVGLLTGLLPVLDDIHRAREHGDVQGAFKGVADALEAFTSKLGLDEFGSAGEPFDPSVHEALMQAEPDPQVRVPTVAAVLQPGYRLRGGGRVLRPARVSVAQPAGDAEPAQQ